MLFAPVARSMMALGYFTSFSVVLGVRESCTLPNVRFARNCGSGHDMASGSTCYPMCGSGYRLSDNTPIKCLDGVLTPATDFECIEEEL